MSVNALARENAFSELNSPLIGTGTGVVTPAQRKAAAKANLGVSTADGLTPIWKQGAAVALNATGTITAASMLAGIITSTSAAAVVATLPTGTVFETAFLAAFPNLANDDAIEFAVVNTGPNSFTIATAAGWTDGGNAFTAVPTATSAQFYVRRTGANTYTIFKVA
jgi:hypothetical protein